MEHPPALGHAYRFSCFDMGLGKRMSFSIPSTRKRTVDSPAPGRRSMGFEHGERRAGQADAAQNTGTGMRALMVARYRVTDQVQGERFVSSAGNEYSRQGGRGSHRRRDGSE